MQYLLTQEEYDSLSRKIKWVSGLNVTREQLQELCTKIANKMPLSHGRPWGCILNKPKLVEYCDDCTVQDICPWPSKQWSK